MGLQNHVKRFAGGPSGRPVCGMMTLKNKAETMRLAGGEVGEGGKVTFLELQDLVGFPAYYDAERKYAFDNIDEAAE